MLPKCHGEGGTAPDGTGQLSKQCCQEEHGHTASLGQSHLCMVQHRGAGSVANPAEPSFSFLGISAGSNALGGGEDVVLRSGGLDSSVNFKTIRSFLISLCFGFYSLLDFHFLPEVLQASELPPPGKAELSPQTQSLFLCQHLQILQPDSGKHNWCSMMWGCCSVKLFRCAGPTQAPGPGHITLIPLTTQER